MAEETMKIYCFWLCKKIGVPFMVDSVEIVAVCPFHSSERPLIDEDTGERYWNHFEDGHLRRVAAEDLIIMENDWIKQRLGLRFE